MTLIQLFRQAQRIHYLQTILMLAGATALGYALRSIVAPTNLVMLYLLVVVVAARWGYAPAMLASAVSVLLFNFFFVPHEYTLQVADAQHVLTFAGLFIVGVMIADLTQRVQQQIAAAERREAQTAELYALSQDLVATIDQPTIVTAVLKHIHETFQAEAAILLDGDEGLSLIDQTDGFHLTVSDRELAKWAFQRTTTAGCGTTHRPENDLRCVPLNTVQEKIGVLVLRLDSQTAGQDPSLLALVDAFANQAALAIDAAHLANQAQQTQLLREREKLQTILLNSISHDLRTPLVSIMGVLSTLRDNRLQMPDDAKQDMLDGAWQDVQRLNRTVGNLLDMSRLEAGMMHLKKDWFHPQELIANARSHLGDRLRQHQLEVDVPSGLPLVPLDLPLMTQVIINLLDNAVKYSDPGTRIEIYAREDDDKLLIDIRDRGEGIPDDDLPYIFDKFYRAHRDGGIAGTGLGLSICEGIVNTHNGSIEAVNRHGGGTTFCIRLPLHTDPVTASLVESSIYEQ